MNMKRLIYFILFMASFMFVSCNHDIDYDYGKYETDKYNAALIKTFGQPASNQTWGGLVLLLRHVPHNLMAIRLN